MLIGNSIAELNTLLSYRCTPLLFAPEGKSPQVMASAVLLEQKGNRYLVTAGHVMDLVHEFGPPFISIRRASDPDYSALAQFQTFICLRTEDAGDMQTDLMYLHLLDETDFFPTFSSFICDADFGDDLDADYFYLVGFAVSRNKRPRRIPAGRTIKKFSSTTLYCKRHPKGERILNELGYRQENHIVLSYNRHSFHRNGLKIFAPKPYGISGGALFGVKKSEQRETAFLCGIATEYDEPKGAILCTRLSVLLTGLRPYRTNQIAFSSDR